MFICSRGFQVSISLPLHGVLSPFPHLVWVHYRTPITSILASWRIAKYSPHISNRINVSRQPTLFLATPSTIIPSIRLQDYHPACWSHFSPMASFEALLSNTLSSAATFQFRLNATTFQNLGVLIFHFPLVT